MGSMDYADLARKLWPFMAGYVQQTGGATSVITAGASSSTSGDAAPAHASFLTLATNPTLTQERTFAVSGLGLSTTDGGAGAAYTVTLTSSSSPGANARILASNASGFLTLPQLTTTTKVRTPLIDTASGDLTLSPATNNTVASRVTLTDRLVSPLLASLADLTMNAGSGLVKLAASNSIQSGNFASQTTGFRATYAGEGDFRYLYIDELRAKTFTVDLTAALAGSQRITKSLGELYQDFTLPAAGQLGLFVVRDHPSAPEIRVFEDRDYVQFRVFTRALGGLEIADAWGDVKLDTSYGSGGFLTLPDGTKTQRYWFYRRTGLTIDDQNDDPITDQNGDPILANNVTTPAGNAGAVAVLRDSVVLDYGRNQGGWHETTTVDGSAASWFNNSPYSHVVTWTLHPKNATVRARFGNLRGITGVSNEFGLFAGAGTSNADQFIRVSSQGVLLNNVPLQLYSAGSQRVNIDQNGTDVWFSNDGGVTKALSWNGSTLALRNSTLTLAGGGGIFGTDAGGLPNFTLVNSAISVNGEALNAGDVLLGSNASDKANLYYDRTAGFLRFRNGTLTTALINTAGALVSGTGVPFMQYDSRGMTVVMGSNAPTDLTNANAITFHQNADRSGTRYGYLGVVNLAGTTVMTLNSNTVLRLETNSDAINLGQSSTLAITSGSGRSITLDVAAGAPAWAILLQKNTQVNANLDVGGTSTLRNTTITGTLSVSSTATLGAATVNGTLNVTSTATLGAATVNGTLNVTSTTTLGAATVNGTLNVTSWTTLSGATLNGDLYLGSNGLNFTTSSDTFRYYSSASELYLSYNGSEKFYFSSGGWGYAKGNWAVWSDARLKNVDGSYEAGLREVMQLAPVRYRMKSDDTTRVGLLAQAVREVLPEMVTETPGTDAGDGTPILAISTSDLVYVLINAVKELNHRVKELETCQ